MTDKELRKLRREDLLQILINQQRQIDELTESLGKAQAALEDRRIVIEESGSVAEAALRLNGVFEAAQAAVDQYAGQMREKADALAAQAQKQADDAQRLAEDVVRSARAEADRILESARREAAPVQAPQASAEPAAQGAEEAPKRRGLFGRRRA